jgi:hypothetical protein
MGRLTDIVVGAAVLVGTFYAGAKCEQYRDNKAYFPTIGVSVVDVIDDAVCGKYKYQDNSINWESFESEEGRYDFADAFHITYSPQIEQEMVEMMFAEMNRRTQVQTITSLKQIMQE